MEFGFFLGDFFLFFGNFLFFFLFFFCCVFFVVFFFFIGGVKGNGVNGLKEGRVVRKVFK